MIAKNSWTHGSVFIPVIGSSDKTTVSVITRHQEYHLVYQSPGNFINMAQWVHGMGVMLVAFLPIPKGKNYSTYSFDCHIYLGHLAWQKHHNKPAFLTFCHQLYHTCLMKIFQPLKAGMTSPKTIHCPDGHWWCMIYNLGPYITNYPEQGFLAGIVQNWCPKWVPVQALCCVLLTLVNS